MKLLVSQSSELAMPIQGLQYVEGDGKQMDGSLLILGGQVLDQPPALSLAGLANESHVHFFYSHLHVQGSTALA